MIENILLAIGAGILWSQVISHLGASILLHRYYCHKQFQVPAWFEVLGLFMLSIAYIRTPIGWIASHRMHHAYSDTEKDPHDWRHLGKWKVLTTTWTLPKIPVRFAKDLFKNPRLVFFHKYHLHLLAAHNIVALAIDPYFWIAYAAVPFVFAKIGFGLLNYYGHSEVGGADHAWLNLFVAGEGYHKQHHDHGKKIRLHKYDTGGWLAERLFK